MKRLNNNSKRGFNQKNDRQITFIRGGAFSCKTFGDIIKG